MGDVVYMMKVYSLPEPIEAFSFSATPCSRCLVARSLKAHAEPAKISSISSSDLPLVSGKNRKTQTLMTDK